MGGGGGGGGGHEAAAMDPTSLPVGMAYGSPGGAPPVRMPQRRAKKKTWRADRIDPMSRFFEPPNVDHLTAVEEM